MCNTMKRRPKKGQKEEAQEGGGERRGNLQAAGVTSELCVCVLEWGFRRRTLEKVEQEKPQPITFDYYTYYEQKGTSYKTASKVYYISLGKKKKKKTEEKFSPREVVE